MSQSGLQRHRAGAFSLLATMLVGMAVYVLSSPLYTWDLVPYVATAISDSATDPTELHRATYAQLQESLPAEAYTSLVSGPYASQMAQDASDFNSQLPMYRVKPGYVGMIKLLGMTGLEPVRAIMLLSLVPGMLIILLLFVWIQRYLGPWGALGVVGLFIPSARLIDISRVPVPDNLSALLLLLAVYGLLVRNWRLPGLVLLVLAITVRINNIVFVVLLLAWLGLSVVRENKWKLDRALLPIVVALFGCIGLYLAITVANGHDWWRLFHHTFVAPIADLDGFAEPFSLSVYLGVMKQALAQLLSSGVAVYTMLPLFLLVGTLAALLPGARQAQSGVVLLLCAPTLLVYFFLFPLVSGWDRFFTPFYALAVVFACEMAARQCRKHE